MRLPCHAVERNFDRHSAVEPDVTCSTKDGGRSTRSRGRDRDRRRGCRARLLEPAGTDGGALHWQAADVRHDLGVSCPTGHLECLGHSDQQIKIRGYRVELGEIEAVRGPRR